MNTVIRMAPRGEYLAWEVGYLAGTSGHKVGQWARRGYIRSSVHEGRPRIYSFQDVAEAMVLHELLERGVRHRDIKKALGRLRDYGDWPLTEAPLVTERGEGRSRVFLVGDEGTYDVGGPAGWQQIVTPEHLEEVREQLRRGGWAVRNLPELTYIEVNPDRLSGRPTIRDRRIAAQDVAEIAEEQGGVEVLHDDYELQTAEIVDARKWWREVRRLAEAA